MNLRSKANGNTEVQDSKLALLFFPFALPPWYRAPQTSATSRYLASKFSNRANIRPRTSDRQHHADLLRMCIKMLSRTQRAVCHLDARTMQFAASRPILLRHVNRKDFKTSVYNSEQPAPLQTTHTKDLDPTSVTTTASSQYRNLTTEPPMRRQAGALDLPCSPQPSGRLIAYNSENKTRTFGMQAAARQRSPRVLLSCCSSASAHIPACSCH